MISTKPPMYQAPLIPKLGARFCDDATVMFPPVIDDVKVVVFVLVVFKTMAAEVIVTVPFAMAPLVITPAAEMDPPVPSNAIKPPLVVILPAR